MTGAALEFDLLSPEAVADPYPLLDALREADPVHWDPRLGAWLVTRYADVSAALRDERFSSDRIAPYRRARLSGPGADPGLASAVAVLENWMVFKDPPDHGRLRRLLSRAFTPRAVQRVRGRIAGLADELLAAVPGPTIDLVGDYAYPLTASVIAELLGVPRADRGRFKEWSDAISGLVFGGLGDPARHADAARGMGELRDYLAALVADRSRDGAAGPDGDLLAALVTARDAGDALSHDEVIATGVLLLFAGHETTTNLIGNGLLALLRRPEAATAVREGRVPIDACVEELLRFDGPAKTIVRLMRTDVELHGRVLRAGDRVFLCPPAANRDPRVFSRPGELDLRRTHNPQLGFGVGLHYCLGAPLARLEAAVAIPRALQLPGLALTEAARTGSGLRWQPVLLSRGLHALPATFGGQA
jgi:cytochrome P450